MELYQYSAVIEKVVDGDTYVVDIDLGFDVHIKQRIRLARINCPELSTDKGKEVKTFASYYKGAEVHIKTNKTDKYGRYIAEVEFVKDNKNLSDLMVTNGFAEYVKY
jgi:endonuclease YncB( thermonuclease family)